MIERICHIDNELEDSIFLFGARQTGKSTFCVRNFQTVYTLTCGYHFKGAFQSSAKNFVFSFIICTFATYNIM